MSGGHITNFNINRKLSARLHIHAVSRSCGYQLKLKKMEDKIQKKNYLYTVLNISLQIIIAEVIFYEK